MDDQAATLLQHLEEAAVQVATLAAELAKGSTGWPQDAADASRLTQVQNRLRTALDELSAVGERQASITDE